MCVLVPRLAYWAILVGGFLLALSAFDTQLTARIVDSVLLLLPRLVAGAAILLAGAWISRYLGRSALVWAFNEGLPSAGRISQAVRVVVLFVSVVVAADYLDFARNVFLAAFVLLVGGAMVLAKSLHPVRNVVQEIFERRATTLPAIPQFYRSLVNAALPSPLPRTFRVSVGFRF